MKNVGIILAAGRGKRMHSVVQKQYLLLQGKPVLYYSLKAFQECPFIDEIILVTGEEEISYCQEEIVRKFNLDKVKQIVPGGKERYHSVYEGLKALQHCDYVLIHDGARPLVTDGIISRAAQAAVSDEACVVGMPVKDTIKVADAGGFAESTPDRSRLWQVQTPQAFSYPLVRSAYDRLMADETQQKGITDDAMVVEHLSGTKVRLVEGSYENLKVTTPEDLVLAEALLKKRMNPRVAV